MARNADQAYESAISALRRRTDAAERVVARAEQQDLDSIGETPLFSALATLEPTRARHLIEHGARLDVSTVGGVTPARAIHKIIQRQQDGSPMRREFEDLRDLIISKSEGRKVAAGTSGSGPGVDEESGNAGGRVVMANTALIFYGRVAELGNFKVMNDSLAKDLRGRYPASGIVREIVELRSRFFDYLRAPPFASSHHRARMDDRADDFR